MYSVEKTEKIDDKIFDQCDENALTDIKILRAKINKAADQLKDTALGPDGIPLFSLRRQR